MYPVIHLAQSIEIPTFFLVISLVLSVSLFWISKRAKLYEISPKQILDLSLILMISCLAGARLFHVFYENPEYYTAGPEKIFYLWDGGFVYFGGAFLGILAAFIYFKFEHIKNASSFFDAFAPVLAFSYGAGRIGCFLAGCCYGAFCDVPWAVEGRHPTQLYATFWEFGVVLVLLGLEKRGLMKRPGNLFILWMGLHAIGRILMESFRDDFRGQQVFGLSISTAICYLLLLLSFTLLFMRRSSAKK